MYEYNTKIISLYDGDTVRADIDLGFGLWIKNQPIRIYGIDSPELSTDAGKAARVFSSSILAVGSSVILTTHKDDKEKYGRYLGKITLPDGSDYGTQMINGGFAKPYFGGAKV